LDRRLLAVSYLNSWIFKFVDHAALYNLVNKSNLVHNCSKYVYFFSLHVSKDYVPIIRRNNCIYATLGFVVTVVSPDDGPIVARNMQRKEINVPKKIVQQVGFNYKIKKLEFDLG